MSKIYHLFGRDCPSSSPPTPHSFKNFGGYSFDQKLNFLVLFYKSKMIRDQPVAGGIFGRKVFPSGIIFRRGAFSTGGGGVFSASGRIFLRESLPGGGVVFSWGYFLWVGLKI